MATSQITNAITDMKTLLAAVPGIQYVAVYNNQVKMEESGATFNFPKPAVLIELRNPMQGVALLGSGVTINEQLVWRLTIVYQELNAIDPTTGLPTGTMDENLSVFALRDAVKAAVTGFRPANCSPLQYVEESPDYNHNQVYVYCISFRCAYTDTKGSPYDPDSTAWTTGQITQVNENAFLPWLSGKTYTANENAVLYPDSNGIMWVYLCTTSNADTTFIPGHWTLINAWVPGTSYTASTSYVAYQDHIFQCLNSNTDATFNPANWTVIN